MVQNQPIIGIIVCAILACLCSGSYAVYQDEIQRKLLAEPERPVNDSGKRPTSSTHGTTKKAKKQRSTPPPSQTDLTFFMTSPPKLPSTRSSTPLPQMYALHVSDTKTRRNSGLPSDDDAKASRLQLMLYHRLLTDLLSPSFDFKRFWKRLSLKPFLRLSDTFLTDAGLKPNLSDDSGIAVDVGFPQCIDDLVDVWRTSCDMLRIARVDASLEIVYRAQSDRRVDAASSREIAQQVQNLDWTIEDTLHGHDLDLQRAIAASLQETVMAETSGKASVAAGDGTNANGLGIDSVMPPFGGETLESSDKGILAWAAQAKVLAEANPQVAEAVVKGAENKAEGERAFLFCLLSRLYLKTHALPGATDFLALGRDSVNAEEPAPEAEDVEAGNDSRIIGRKTFDMDDSLLDAYMKSVLSWWHGSRPPEGVDEKHTMRC